MSVYPDASYLLSLFTIDAHTARAKAFLHAQKPLLSISDFAAAEFASVIARCVRMQLLTKDDARSALTTFDAWSARFAKRVQLASADIAAADSYLRRLDLTLRTPDAIHIAAAQRLGAALLTFDKKMASAANRLGTAIASV